MNGEKSRCLNINEVVIGDQICNHLENIGFGNNNMLRGSWALLVGYVNQTLRSTLWRSNSNCHICVLILNFSWKFPLCIWCSNTIMWWTLSLTTTYSLILFLRYKSLAFAIFHFECHFGSKLWLVGSFQKLKIRYN